MIYLFLIGYLLPLIISATAHYLDEETETVKDFLIFWWAILIPFINIVSLIAIILCLLSPITDRLAKKLDKFLSIKLKK